MTDGISEIGKSIQQLNNHLLQFYTPAVQDMCNRENITESELEHFLDYLVSACISDDMIFLFKKVCKRFYKEYPETIMTYIMIYKEYFSVVQNFFNSYFIL